ncbi:hypothetical protein [Leucobacter ruminantium]|uniref:Uncharacterized protein n=2 Tax=Leucobacter TaxID=55968 RepID=A0A939LXB1_9MICO|nr:hypothetical protein [Leucobacter ruminantium]MBO1806156.1 hypothetical protein [Leucobacter ruminantium]
MTNKLGGNEEQVRRFIDAAQSLSSSDIEPVVTATRRQEVRDAGSRILDVPRSASHYAAIESAVRGLEKDVRAKLPQSTTTAERMTMGSFTSLLGLAVFALASRTQLDDNTVALVVDPFARRLGFEWRSWGVPNATRNLWSGEPNDDDAAREPITVAVSGEPDDDVAPAPRFDRDEPAWAARIVVGVSEELGDRERQQLAHFLDPDYSARIEDDEPETKFEDIYVSQEHRFSLGAELIFGIGYLSIPVSTGLVDYEEYYALNRDEFEQFRKDPELALPLVEQCRRREQDGRLMQQLPVTNRGVPV